ncbi:hypothetical protein LZ198_27475 [Myxococcus sp. K15C18031901]|uniref:hypothetical protein n=1 Tax=Myxococcus dinghuensis TaxID=2906761 RepID=UPI0020A79347|nr:hypothetical protein [Myxococcus dinghuensis]MCP3102621.1 hypothetical protein [Myxococcus dinghuensis]
MDRAGRGVLFLAALAMGVLGAGCGEQRDGGHRGGGIPSADDRERRSALMRDLVASRERAPDPDALRGPEQQGVGELGQGGSGKPAPTGSFHGSVAWVGDNELLIRDAQGAERDVGVVQATRLLLNGHPVGLAAMKEGDPVDVTYDDGPGGWVAREVTVVPRADSLIPTEQEVRERRARERSTQSVESSR